VVLPLLPFKALLIDFDNTLVLFNEDEFLVAYAKFAYPYLAEYFDESTFFQKLLQSTLCMIHNDGRQLNVDAFTNHFIADVPALSFEECKDRFETFYDESFHKLGTTIQVVPYGRELIQQAINAKLQVVIATNPIFPKRATEIRLSWANLAELDIAFSTHAENMSYCKPKLEYYHAILERLSHRPEDCIMAGNDEVSDMAASALGVHTFLVDLDQEKGRLGMLSKEIGNSAKKTVTSKYRIDARGTLEDLSRYLFTT
jgi:FMN phosphatase YigB (HAD superfamily)